uniref:Uncharacterized protein n=1 Tax=Chrysotila carterae TaxID=13221 RepID=A0A6S9YIC5_CHRCT
MSVGTEDSGEGLRSRMIAQKRCISRDVLHRHADTNPTGRRAALLHDLAEEQDHQQLIDEVAALLDAASVQSPLLLSLAPAALDGEDPASVAAAVEEAYLLHVAEYGLCDPVETHHISWTAECAAPVSNVLLDAAHDGASGRWDVSRVVALDGVVDEALRRRLLSLLGDGDDWEPARGPDRRVWHDRAFSDTTQHGASHSGASWGLSGERIRALCQTANEGGAPPEAIVELQSRLCELLRHFNAVNVTVCRMPNAVFGEEVPPIAANAPVFADGDCYGWHIDADPLLVPPSPWTDAFGRYPNRSPAKPRFVSALVYLSPEWRPEWGAPTRFLDLPTSKVISTRFDCRRPTCASCRLCCLYPTGASCLTLPTQLVAAGLGDCADAGETRAA